MNKFKNSINRNTEQKSLYVPRKLLPASRSPAPNHDGHKPEHLNTGAIFFSSNKTPYQPKIISMMVIDDGVTQNYPSNNLSNLINRMTNSTTMINRNRNNNNNSLVPTINTNHRLSPTTAYHRLASRRSIFSLLILSCILISDLLKSTQASNPSIVASLLSRAPSPGPSIEELMSSRLFIPNRLASYVNYNRQSLNNHHTDTSKQRPRWLSLLRSRPSSGSTSSSNDNQSTFRPTSARVLSLLFNNINSRLGINNGIRVSNVMRDLAWQILARLSIPTPVIYELRRMNIYSPDEHFNDILGNKSVTIRSKKMLERHKRSIIDRIRSALTGEDSEDEEGSSSLLSRITDLFDRSNNGGIFGRVIRVPFWLPFKRGEQGSRFFLTGKHKSDDDDDHEPIIKIPGNKQIINSNNKVSATRAKDQKSNSTRKSSGNSKGWSKKSSASENRPLISVDGKNYYLDDSNKLRSSD